MLKWPFWRVAYLIATLRGLNRLRPADVPRLGIGCQIESCRNHDLGKTALLLWTRENQEFPVILGTCRGHLE